MKFSSKKTSEFFNDMNKKVDNYFAGLPNGRFANSSIVIKGISLLTIYFGSYGFLLSGKWNVYGAIILLIILGWSAVMLVFNLVHDASHKALFKKPAYNKIVTLLGDIIGINTYIWDIRHNIQHHSFTNVLGGDIIIENIPLIRLNPHQERLWFHKYQALYAPLFYMLYSLYWMLVIDFRLFWQKEICNLKNIRHPRKEWIKLFAFKLLYVAYMLIIPWMVLDLSFGTILAGFLVMHLAAGILLSSVALLGHFVEGPEFVTPDENGIIHNSWMEHELETTIDFSPSSKMMNWITGGLNTHIAHHLYPKVCHCHYYKLTEIIRSHCESNGITYKKHSFFNALLSHYRYLKKLSV